MMITKQVRAEVRERRSELSELDGKKVPGSIPFLTRMLRGVSEPNDRDEILSELAGEYLRAGMEDDHIAVQRERVSNQPRSAVVLAGLAHSLSMQNNHAQEAKDAASKALAIARTEGVLIRFALVCQADIARRINDPSLFEYSLNELIADAPNQREDDSWLNEHLVADLPVGFCSSELVNRYRDILREGS